ncbi:hypothetical protein DFQ30_006602 [Apophysomyces sp. BC1015]|nr:hypothetical protein DFQ30_006602 [Apophysomyces sp. BC1015]KAG0176886.1 hypothetical protein DFQ29_005495 [Apophysomyces sp. BC1021]
MMMHIQFFAALALFASSVLGATINADKAALECPQTKLACPPCGDDTCIYPNSGGCSGAGFPACKPKHCEKLLCMTRRIEW